MFLQINHALFMLREAAGLGFKRNSLGSLENKLFPEQCVENRQRLGDSTDKIWKTIRYIYIYRMIVCKIRGCLKKQLCYKLYKKRPERASSGLERILVCRKFVLHDFFHKHLKLLQSTQLLLFISLSPNVYISPL